MAQSKAMYQALQVLSSSSPSSSSSSTSSGVNASDLTPTQKRVVECALQDARLSGIGLEGEKRERYESCVVLFLFCFLFLFLVFVSLSMGVYPYVSF
jgi:Zn-dependent oligopeptidase